MYNVTTEAVTAWEMLFDHVAKTSGVALNFIEYPAPASLDKLWTRADLGCVFMCGWPYSVAKAKPKIIAAPIPVGSRYHGQAIYFTDLIVRKDAGYNSLEDTFGGRIGWTTENSHSGFNAPRNYLLKFRTSERTRLYAESIGKLLTPANSLESVVSGKVDIAPLDSFALDLIRQHEPERLEAVTIIATTSAAPIPPIIASNGLSQDVINNLRHSFLSLGQDEKMSGVLNSLGLLGFTYIAPKAYSLAKQWDKQALTLDYRRPE